MPAKLAWLALLSAAIGCSQASRTADGGSADAGAAAASLDAAMNAGREAGAAMDAASSDGAQGGSGAQGGGAPGAGDAGGSGAGDGGSGSGSASCDGGACNVIPVGLLDPERTTTWNPGILSDEQLHLPLGSDGLPVRTEICAMPSPGDDLSQAISACPEGRVVQLGAGTYTTSSTITLTKGVVLRGSGSSGAMNGGTTIERTGAGSVLAIGSSQDQACYSSGYGTAYALTADAVKESVTVTVGTNAGQFAKGDLALLDEADDANVQEGDCQYFKRVDKRSVSERVEVAAVDATGGTLRLSTPLHWTFRTAAPHSAQIAKVAQPITRWAGIEHVLLRGGSNPGYNGQMAGGIDASNAAFCWIKDVQTDESIGGMHVALTGTFRTVVRDSHFHNSANYGFGADCYGIVLRCGAADNLIENNIARYMNKPILFNVSGGGNVVGYNYADNSWATPAAWQEVNIDTHCAFPHMELIEGNYAPHMGATITHGNAGYLTYFRNYASSQFAPPAVAGSTDTQTGNITALQFDSGDIDMSVVGNVLGSSSANDLGTAPVSTTYIASGPDAPSIFELGDNASHNGSSQTDVAFTSLWSHANYDPVSAGVVWNPTIAVRTLPASLYLAAKPAWWPVDEAWPWVGPELSQMVGTLPAKRRSDSLGP